MNQDDNPTFPGSGDPEVDAAELLRRGLQSRPVTGDPGNWEPPSPEDLGKLLPQYHIECLLGRGGMGAVYKGSQVALEREVAVKLLPSEVAADESFVARFKREAKTLARLQHPGIVAVHDFGQTSEGHLYFIMEFVNGTDLHKLIRGPGLNAAQSLEIVTQVCDALQYAHGRGVMHRDIKPANVLLTLDGRAKLADFGLARPVEEDSGAMTRSDIVMGTPDYIAPEQMYGTPDHRADLYSLGVMLYEMLTGRPPRGSWMPPSQKVQVDIRLDQVIIRALQEDPERRYQQASELKTDVEVIRTTPIRLKKGKANAGVKAKVPVDRGADESGPAPQKQRGEGISLLRKLVGLALACIVLVVLGLAVPFLIRLKDGIERRGNQSGAAQPASDDNPAEASVAAQDPQPVWQPLPIASKEEKLPDGSIRTVAENRILPGFKDGAINLTVRWSKKGSLTLKVRQQGQDGVQLVLSHNGLIELAELQDGKLLPGMRRFVKVNPPAPEEAWSVDFAVIKDVAYAWVNGVSLILPGIKAGEAGSISANNGGPENAVNNIRYPKLMVLDGVLDPLKALSWSVRGAWWKDFLAEWRASPEGRAADNPILVQEGDAWRLSQTTGPSLSRASDQNLMVRATGRFGTAPSWGVYSQMNAKGEGFIAELWTSGRVTLRRLASSPTAVQFSGGPPFDANASHTLQLRTEGQDVVVHLDGKRMLAYREDKPVNTNGGGIGLVGAKGALMEQVEYRQWAEYPPNPPQGEALAVPGLKWTKALIFEDTARPEPINRDRDGWLETGSGYLRVATAEKPGSYLMLKDGAFRTRVLWEDNSLEDPFGFHFRYDTNSANSGDSFSCSLRRDRLFVITGWGEPDETNTLLEMKLPRAFEAGEETELGIAGIGNDFWVRVNGQVGHFKAPHMRPMGWSMMGGWWKRFKAPEYVKLDGVTDPLKALGWEIPVTASAKKPDEGGLTWKSVTMQPDVAEQAATNHGWVTLSRWYLGMLNKPEFADCALRLRYRWVKGSLLSISLRDTKDYSARVTLNGSGKLEIDNWEKQAQTEAQRPKSKLELGPDLAPHEGILEFAVIGQRAYARRNGQSLSPLALSNSNSGMCVIGNGYMETPASVRDVEYVSLVGVADPLKALGWEEGTTSRGDGNATAPARVALPAQLLWQPLSIGSKRVKPEDGFAHPVPEKHVLKGFRDGAISLAPVWGEKGALTLSVREQGQSQVRLALSGSGRVELAELKDGKVLPGKRRVTQMPRLKSGDGSVVSFAVIKDVAYAWINGVSLSLPGLTATEPGSITVDNGGTEGPVFIRYPKMTVLEGEADPLQALVGGAAGEWWRDILAEWRTSPEGLTSKALPVAQEGDAWRITQGDGLSLSISHKQNLIVRATGQFGNASSWGVCSHMNEKGEGYIAELWGSGMVTLRRQAPSPTTLEKANGDKSFDPGASHTLQLRTEGRDVLVYLDGVRKIGFQDNQAAPRTGGRLGLLGGKGALIEQAEYRHWADSPPGTRQGEALTIPGLAWQKAYIKSDLDRPEPIIRDGKGWLETGADTPWLNTAERPGEFLRMKDGAFRVRLLWGGKEMEEPFLIAARQDTLQSNPGAGVVCFCWKDKLVALNDWAQPNEKNTLYEMKFARAFEPGEETEFAILGVGDEFWVRVNGQVGHFKAPMVRRTGWNTLGFTWKQFKDFEYVKLDGVADPLKALGWGYPQPASTKTARDTAEWILSLGGIVTVRDRAREIEIREKAQLPSGPVVLTRINYLDMTNFKKIKAADFSLLSLASALSTLRIVFLPDEITSLEALAGLTQLETIELGGGGSILDDELRHLTQLQKLTSLTVRLKGEAGAGCAHLSGLKSLNSLSLRGCKVNEQGALALMRLDNLVTLQLDRGLDDTNQGLLRHIADMKNLKSLALTAGVVSKEGFMQLAALNRLEKLELTNSKIDNTGFGYLKALGNSLRELQMQYGATVSDEGVRDIVANFPNLELISISLGATCTAASIKELAKLPKLKSVFWWRKGLSQDDFRYFADLPALTELAISETGIRDESLTPFLRSKTLKSLNLYGNAITDNGLNLLQKMTSLKSLQMQKTQVTDAGVAAFKAARPDVSIVW